MADQTDPPKRSWFQAWPHWTMFLLVASLAVNLLIAGALGMRYFSPERLERWSGASFTQLLPRRFLSDLPEDRRREFLDLLKSRREVFRESRAGMRDAALRFAEALERDPVRRLPRRREDSSSSLPCRRRGMRQRRTGRGRGRCVRGVDRRCRAAA